MTPMALTTSRSLLFVLLSAACAVILPGQASAAPRWVNDEIRITFRAGPGDDFRILRYLNTGARLETAAPAAGRYSAESMEGWSYLTDAAGNSGWVRDQYLTDEPPARVRIDAVVSERDRARERVATLTAELNAAQSANTDLTRQLEESQSRIADLETRFAAARGGFELVETNQALEQTIGELRDRNAALQQANEALSDQSLKQWFLIGAGVLGTGILLGLLLPSLRRKRDPWGSGSL